MKCTEARTVGWPEVWDRVLRVSYIIALSRFPTGGANDAQNVRVESACGKDNDQQNLKNDNPILQGITRSLQMSEDTIILFISS